MALGRSVHQVGTSAGNGEAIDHELRTMSIVAESRKGDGSLMDDVNEAQQLVILRDQQD